MEDNDPLTLQSQYHRCWWRGDTKSQGINSHVTDQILPQYSYFSPRRVEYMTNGTF